MSLTQQYTQKKISATQAAGMVKSGDWLDFGQMLTSPITIDKALSARVGEISDVKIRTSGYFGFPEVVMADPEQKSFNYNTLFLTVIDRALNADGIVSHIPCLYYETPRYIREGHQIDIAFIRTTPMDNNGFFNYGMCNSSSPAILSKAKTVVVEIHEEMPYSMGGYGEAIHISDVDFIVESDNAPLPELPEAEITENDRKIAGHIIKEIKDGACLQLGIGGMPNVLGKLIAQTDLKDLGVHTEMMMDGFLDLFEAGKITNLKKAADHGKMIYTFAMGTKRLYDFIHNNPACASFPVDYTNDPARIAANDRAISINGCLEVDLFCQVSSESAGLRQISGTGGQLDYHYGAYHSKEGNAFVCTNSTRTDKDGKIHSAIRPVLSPGTIVTMPRTMVDKVVTEYGIASLKGKSTWERAEELINIAHPDFRDELIREAKEMKIFTNQNLKI